MGIVSWHLKEHDAPKKKLRAQKGPANPLTTCGQPEGLKKKIRTNPGVIYGQSVGNLKKKGFTKEK